MEVTDARGEVIERWDGLRLRAVEVLASREAWPEALLSPYLERRLEELAGAGAPVRVAFERGLREERPAGTDAMIQQALGKTARLWRRPDGKPVSLGKEEISAAHTNDFTLAVAGVGGAACDLAEVAARDGRRVARSFGRGKVQARGADGARAGGKPGHGGDTAVDGDGVPEKNRSAGEVAAGAGVEHGGRLDTAAVRLDHDLQPAWRWCAKTVAVGAGGRAPITQ